MKVFVLAMLMTTSVFAAPTAKQKILPVTNDQEVVKKDKVTQDKLKALEKKEDCDDKAKKPVEIKAESISLTGNTGCSLE